jgi:hypothetical protein
MKETTHSCRGGSSVCMRTNTRFAKHLPKRNIIGICGVDRTGRIVTPGALQNVSNGTLSESNP